MFNGVIMSSYLLIALRGGCERVDLDYSLAQTLETCALSSIQDLLVNNSAMTAKLVRECLGQYTCEIDNIVDSMLLGFIHVEY